MIWVLTLVFNRKLANDYMLFQNVFLIQSVLCVGRGAAGRVCSFVLFLWGLFPETLTKVYLAQRICT